MTDQRPAGPRTLRVALHAHSTWSYDGKWELTALARAFGRAGYDAVLMTEHDTGFAPDAWPDYAAACAAASTPRCRIVPGIEYSSPDNSVHILTWGVGRFLAEHRPVAETLAAVAEAGGSAIFAHPKRRDAWTRFDSAWVPLLHGIELWNRKTDGLAPGAEAARLIAESGLAPTVGVDFHTWRQSWPLSQRVVLGQGDDLETGIVHELRCGRTVPCVFGRPIRTVDGVVKVPFARRLERGRRALRRLRGRG